MEFSFNEFLDVLLQNFNEEPTWKEVFLGKIFFKKLVEEVFKEFFKYLGWYQLFLENVFQNFLKDLVESFLKVHLENHSVVTKSQGTVFRVVGDLVPLVVLGRQRDLGDALRGDVVLSGSQYVKFCLVRLSSFQELFCSFWEVLRDVSRDSRWCRTTSGRPRQCPCKSSPSEFCKRESPYL